MDFWYLTLYLLLHVRHVIRSLLESLKDSQEISSFWIRMDFKKKLKNVANPFNEKKNSLQHFAHTFCDIILEKPSDLQNKISIS